MRLLKAIRMTLKPKKKLFRLTHSCDSSRKGHVALVDVTAQLALCLHLKQHGAEEVPFGMRVAEHGE